MLSNNKTRLCVMLSPGDFFRAVQLCHTDTGWVPCVNALFLAKQELSLAPRGPGFPRGHPQNLEVDSR